MFIAFVLIFSFVACFLGLWVYAEYNLTVNEKEWGKFKNSHYPEPSINDLCSQKQTTNFEKSSTVFHLPRPSIEAADQTH